MTARSYTDAATMCRLCGEAAAVITGILAHADRRFTA